MSTLFTATEHHLYNLLTNVINASKPAGLGMLNYKDKTYTIHEIKIRFAMAHLATKHFEIGWFEGRRVDLSIRVVAFPDSRGIGTYAIEYQPRPTYQTWIHKYPTNELLIKYSDACVLEKETADEVRSEKAL
jgi:hypothetical protein